ncbi:MAG: TIGR03364 family FAD-dependent oxidoreductase [Bacteroidia bacterium]
MQLTKKAVVIGAGIVGLATARALALKGFKVTIFERSEKAVGASIRNFGMIWPIGQPEGELYNRAIRSKQIWKEIADGSGIWFEEAGSLHLAHHQDEWEVLQELYEIFKTQGRPVKLLDSETILSSYNCIKEKGLLGGLFSETETIVDPREAIASIPNYLTEQLGVNFIWCKTITNVESNRVWVNEEIFDTDIVCICSGADFEILYPEVFNKLEITKCKLQMLRFKTNEETRRLGTSLCGGLSLIHYSSFKAAPSLNQLQKRYDEEMGEYIKWGIHVMVAQNGNGELTVGDSHEYGLKFDPFDKAHINELILKYLDEFTITNGWKPIETWHGIYPKMTNGQAGVFMEVDRGVYIINGLGGAGMTLSFGFAEEVIETI